MRVWLSIVVLLALLAPTASAREEWYDHYAGALAALERGDHAAAIELIEHALQRKSRSGYLRTYGNNYIRYTPHFQLGVAQQQAGDCEAALASLEQSESRNETKGVPELQGRLQQLRDDCTTRLAPPPLEVTAVTEPPPRVEPQPKRPTIDRAGLERGLGAYLEGDFAGSIRSFEALTVTHPDSARLRLLLGMSFHGAWVVGGETDDALIGRARVELSGAAGLDPGLTPDPALCPPRVAALFRSLR